MDSALQTVFGLPKSFKLTSKKTGKQLQFNLKPNAYNRVGGYNPAQVALNNAIKVKAEKTFT